jgi:hypothetical protein
MRKHPITLQSFMIVGSFGAWLLGCPVWGEPGAGPDAYPNADAGIVTTDNPPVIIDAGPRACTVDRDCASGYCDASRHCASAPACTASASCASGSYCETSRNVCVPGCSTNAQCTSVAAGLVCDTNARRCVPGGGCTSNTDCAATPATPVCLGGSCQPAANQCQFEYQCTGAGQACVDGLCIVGGCTAANVATVCAAGQVCTNSRCAYPTTNSDCGGRCTTAQLCVSGTCLATCTADAQCGTGQRCDGGVCRVDTRPRPFCTMDSQCSNGSVCNNGACRRPCSAPGAAGDMECRMFDVQLPLCVASTATRSLCNSPTEAHPQCARTADCTAGRTCVNAACQ